jgi:hypothetical protein
MNKTFEKVLTTNGSNVYLKNHPKIQNKILQQKKRFIKQNLLKKGPNSSQDLSIKQECQDLPIFYKENKKRISE